MSWEGAGRRRATSAQPTPRGSTHATGDGCSSTASGRIWTQTGVGGRDGGKGGKCAGGGGGVEVGAKLYQRLHPYRQSINGSTMGEANF